MADVFRTKDYLTGTSFIDNGVKAITAQRLRDFVVTVTPSVQTKTSDYQMNADTDSVILGNHASTPFTVTLPPVTGLDGKTCTVKNINDATVTVDGYGDELIDGYGFVTLSQKWQDITAITDGYGWYTLGGI